MKDLEDSLMNIATSKVAIEDLENEFDNVAFLLLQKTKIVAGESEYLLREIEFYFSSEHYSHRDKYAHCNMYKTPNVKRQGNFGEWYFHRYRSPENYIRQRHRGVDLTFGKAELGNFGGILIRKIQQIENHQTIEGISNVVEELIGKIGIQNLESIATGSGKLIFNTKSLLHLSAHKNLLDRPIFKTVRKLPEDKKMDKFYSKLYRYFNYPETKQVHR